MEFALVVAMVVAWMDALGLTEGFTLVLVSITIVVVLFTTLFAFFGAKTSGHFAL
jgi:hypothetical protein